MALPTSIQMVDVRLTPQPLLFEASVCRVLLVSCVRRREQMFHQSGRPPLQIDQG